MGDIQKAASDIVQMIIADCTKDAVNKVTNKVEAEIQFIFSELRKKFNNEEDFIVLQAAFENVLDSLATFKVYAEKM
jgi:5'-deoxynucleotidase YfbR-like HD superfamily hydrolase